MKKWSLFMVLLPFVLFSQSSQVVEKPRQQYVFAQIFTGFRYGLNNNVEPRAAFEFAQGILGYYHEISSTVTGMIMLDVTRTTNIYDITDSTGNTMTVNYFEGSKYTAYLKLAMIKWDISERFTLRVGQLLNTQYLTFTDPFWGYRYIDVTFQEKYRLGNPADFGAQFDVRTGNLLHQVSVVNGEGPFRYQDDKSGFIYSYNVQYNSGDKIFLKLYVDLGTKPHNSGGEDLKYAGSFFAGYRTKKFKIGGEIDYVKNYAWERERDHYGVSVFAGYKIARKFDLIGRYDRLVMETSSGTSYENYIICGAQYEPVEMFTTSLNFRYYTLDSLPMVYVNFGLKF